LLYTVVVTDIGRIIVVLGGVLIVVGLVIMLLGRAHVPIGRLPGDVVYRGKNSTVYFPIVTCVVISVVLSLVMWLVGRVGR
jgi:ribose/xylose/arabinose/galactoside ABC-type transport system permease subunit